MKKRVQKKKLGLILRSTRIELQRKEEQKKRCAGENQTNEKKQKTNKRKEHKNTNIYTNH